jgi:hypothetical protein
MAHRSSNPMSDLFDVAYGHISRRSVLDRESRRDEGREEVDLCPPSNESGGR